MICRRELRILKLEDFWEKVALQETYHLTILVLFPAKLQTLAIGILVLVSQLSLYKQMCVMMPLCRRAVKNNYVKLPRNETSQNYTG